MFGFSFSEVVLIAVVTLVAVGPQRLPGMLKSLAQWMRKLRKMTVEVRQQTGIDEMLRAEGLQGGLNELRGLMRGGVAGVAAGPLTASPATYRPVEDPYKHIEIDLSGEYPPEGPDAQGALPDDLTTVAEETTAAPAPADTVPAADASASLGDAKPSPEPSHAAADIAKPAADVRPA